MNKIPEKCLSCRSMRASYICNEFVHWEPGFIETSPMPCADAYDKLCRGEDWSPTLKFRLKKLLKR